MAARRVDVRKVDAGDSDGRWRKAKEHAKWMDEALKAGAIDTACLLATHAAIAACDAFTIRHLGVRSSSEQHLDASYVVLRVQKAGVSQAAKHLDHILIEKSSIEYSGRTLRPGEAESLCLHARRFLEFVGGHLA